VDVVDDSALPDELMSQVRWAWHGFSELIAQFGIGLF
jgi:hypothetical protein